MRVSNCVCHEISFKSIKELAARLSTSDIEKLQEEEPFGLNCGMCLPYINRTLKTGETTFTEIVSDDV